MRKGKRGIGRKNILIEQRAKEGNENGRTDLSAFNKTCVTSKLSYTANFIHEIL